MSMGSAELQGRASRHRESVAGRGGHRRERGEAEATPSSRATS